jgi:hypothetical protein
MNPLTKEIAAIQSSPEDIYVIHCSQSAAGNVNHYNPRISCIYVQNLNSSEGLKFSIEKYASKNKIDINDITDWYDDLEIYVLDDFNTFLKSKLHCTFIYWAEEGKELLLDIIKSRYEELNKEDDKKAFCRVPISNRKTVQHLVKKVFQDDEIPKDLKQFIKHHNNEQLINGFLNNAEESICFDKKDFNTIGTSVVSKVDFFISVINDYSSRDTMQVKDVNSDAIDLQSMNPFSLLRRLNIKSWLLLISIFSAGIGIGKYFLSQEINTLQNDKSQLEKEITDQQNMFKDSIDNLKAENLKLVKQLKVESDSLISTRALKSLQ